MFAWNITVNRTDAEGRGQREVRDMIVCRDLFDKLRHELRIFDAFPDERMENGSAGVAGLQRLLKIKRFEEVIRIADRQLG